MSRKKPRPENYHDRQRAPRGRGEGGIYQRADGTWCGQVSLGYDAQGKRIRPTVYGATKTEVLDKIDALRQNARLGKPVEPTKITVKEHFEDWLRTKKPPKTRPSTYGMYEWHVNTHIIPKLGNLKLKDVDYRHINRFYEELDETLAVRTVYDIASTLRAGLADAAHKKLIPENPAIYAESRPKGDKEERFLNQVEMAAFLLAAKGERLEDAFILAMETGMRPGEWLGLPWEAIDFAEATLRVSQHLHEDSSGIYLGPPKTEAGKRTINLSAEALAALKRQRIRLKKERLKAGERWSPPTVERPYSPNLVFPNTIGGFSIRTNILKRDFRRVLHRAALVRMAWRNKLDANEILDLYKKSGGGTIKEGADVRLGDRVYTIERNDILYDVSLNTLRHTHVSILFAMNVDLDSIARMIGHEDGSITLRKYAHMMPGKGEQVANAVDEFMDQIRLAVNRQ